MFSSVTFVCFSFSNDSLRTCQPRAADGIPRAVACGKLFLQCMRCSQRRGSVLQKSSSGLRQSFNGYGRRSAHNMSPRFHAQVQNFRMVQSTDFPSPGGARSKIAVSTGTRSRELARPLPPPSGSWQNAPTSRLGLENKDFVGT